MQRRAALAGLALAATLPPPTARAQVRDVADALDKAGRLRMLGQRLVKAYVAIGLDILPEVADRVLEASQGRFDRWLVELKAFAPGPEIRSTYLQLDAAWTEFKTTLLGSAPTRAGAQRLLLLGEQMLALSHQGLAQLEVVTGRPGSRPAAVAGRQRLHGQRMAALTLAAAWGVRGRASLQDAARARDEHAQAHAMLLESPATPDAVRAELALAATQFGFLETALDQVRLGGATTRTLRDVFTTSERLLEVMEGVVAQLARASP